MEYLCACLQCYSFVSLQRNANGESLREVVVVVVEVEVEAAGVGVGVGAAAIFFSSFLSFLRCLVTGNNGV